MKKIFLILAAAVALSSLAFAEDRNLKTANDNKSFIVSRRGSEVAAVSEEEVFDNAKILSQTDRKDPTSVLISFFVSYSCGGFNTPTLCVEIKGIESDCNTL